MTRDEYRTAVQARFENVKGLEHCWQQINFYYLLDIVAIRLFVENDVTSELAIETRRRLIEMGDTGESP